MLMRDLRGQGRTFEDWKAIDWGLMDLESAEAADGHVRIWSQQHESMDPTCLV